jgi:hypothetical protein
LTWNLETSINICINFGAKNFCKIIFSLMEKIEALHTCIISLLRRKHVNLSIIRKYDMLCANAYRKTTCYSHQIALESFKTSFYTRECIHRTHQNQIQPLRGSFTKIHVEMRFIREFMRIFAIPSVEKCFDDTTRKSTKKKQHYLCKFL